MIPYIVTLIFLIVIILYQVYATSESFSTVADASGNPIIMTDASGNELVTTTDASGAEVKLSLTDLFGLLGPFTMKTKPSEKEKTESTPAPAETETTPKSTTEIEERIAKSIAKQVKDELMSQRATDEVYDKYAPCDLTDAQAQGQEFDKAKPLDMSEYIRKDSIPCWNCSVP